MKETLSIEDLSNFDFILLRGIPGSGKTTLAHSILNKYPVFVHLEADMYFITNDMKYKYIKSLIP